MTNDHSNRPALRFDHREITVIFCLFIFVSLLMFTVGILVGKGLAQAKYEGMALSLGKVPATTAALPIKTEDQAPEAAVAAPASEKEKWGSSVSEGDTASSGKDSGSMAENDAEEKVDSKPEAKSAAPLKLIPEHPRHGDLAGNSLQEPAAEPSAADVIKNPKIRALIENEPNTKPSRATASLPKSAGARAPTSLPQGKFTVQVGSYPTREDAEQRVAQLKKLGFPYAYFSAKELEVKKDTWYRVCLGYFPDQQSAERGGRALQERGEVKNYLVRKTDNSG